MGRLVMDMARPGRRAAWYAGFAVYAAGVALLSGPGLDHWWGAWAACGYAAATVIAVLARRRRWGAGLAVAVSLAGALAGPAWWLATREPVPPDVAVVARSGTLLLHHGTPYLPLPALAAGGWLAYNPYLPVMALFGLPGALGAPGETWPWLIAATFLLLLATVRVTSPGRPARAAVGPAAFWLACPIMAFPLTMGITDPPVIALMCLALALLARAGRRELLPGAPGRRRDLLAAALVLAVACAMKYTAWPALVIIAVMVATRDGAAAAARFAGVVLAAAAALVAALAPAALAHPAALARNTVAYPLGLTTATSPAQSPLPGHLLATLGPAGHLAALLLLAAAGLAVAVSLFIAPPATPAAAAVRVAAGLTALFLLSPATRFGYFVYPLNLCVWALLAAGPRAAGRGAVPPAPPTLDRAGARLGHALPATAGPRELAGASTASAVAAGPPTASALPPGTAIPVAADRDQAVSEPVIPEPTVRASAARDQAVREPPAAAETAAGRRGGARRPDRPFAHHILYDRFAL